MANGEWRDKRATAPFPKRTMETAANVNWIGGVVKLGDGGTDRPTLTEQD